MHRQSQPATGVVADERPWPKPFRGYSRDSPRCLPGPITQRTLDRSERHNALDTVMGDRLLAELLGLAGIHTSQWSC